MFFVFVDPVAILTASFFFLHNDVRYCWSPIGGCIGLCSYELSVYYFCDSFGCPNVVWAISNKFTGCFCVYDVCVSCECYMWVQCEAQYSILGVFPMVGTH